MRVGKSKRNDHLEDLRADGNIKLFFNPFNAQLNPICHLLALLGAHHILHVSGLRVKVTGWQVCLF
jgi:hypothetical protein